MQNNPLGKKTQYADKYNPDLLFPIPRKPNRDNIGLKQIIFKGYDIWNSFEFSWLGKNGKPENRLLKVTYSSDSENIVESKSFKLYLNSYHMSKFDSEDVVLKHLHNDLNNALKSPFIKIDLLPLDTEIKINTIPKKYLVDNIDTIIDTYDIDKSLLKVVDNPNNEKHKMYSNLLKGNCPVTGQPDWGTVYVEYKSNKKIDEKSFLKYIVSFRNHQDYHETSCERIFDNIMKLTNASELIVKCFYTRRGGIDINPCRFYGVNPDNIFDYRFIRQ